MRRALIPLTVASALLLPAGGGAGAATTVRVTAGSPSELDFSLSKRRVAAGRVTFRVANRGDIRHDFKIAGRKTRLLGAGGSATLRVTLRRGRNRYLCTVPGHADGGMRGVIVGR